MVACVCRSSLEGGRAIKRWQDAAKRCWQPRPVALPPRDTWTVPTQPGAGTPYMRLAGPQQCLAVSPHCCDRTGRSPQPPPRAFMAPSVPLSRDLAPHTSVSAARPPQSCTVTAISRLAVAYASLLTGTNAPRAGPVSRTVVAPGVGSGSGKPVFKSPSLFTNHRMQSTVPGRPRSRKEGSGSNTLHLALAPGFHLQPSEYA